MKIVTAMMVANEPAIRVQDSFKNSGVNGPSDPSTVDKLSTSSANYIFAVLTCSQMHILCEHTLLQ